MILLPLLLSASGFPSAAPAFPSGHGIQADGGHAGLHPADASFFIEVPDLRLLFDAYLGAPAVQLLDDPEVQAFAARVAGESAEDYRLRTEVLDRAAGAVRNLPPQIAGAVSLLGDARAFSLSLSVAEMGELVRELRASESEEHALELITSQVGVLCFLDFQSAEAATDAAEMLSNIPGTRALEDGDVPPLDIRGASGTPRRLEIEGAPLGYWVVAAGNTVALGLGSATPGSIAGRAEDPSRALANLPAYHQADEEFLAAEGVTVYESWTHLDRLSDLVRVSTWGVPDQERAMITNVVEDLVGNGAMNSHTRSRLVGDRFVVESLSTQDDPDAGVLSFMGTDPIDAETISFVPSEAVGAWVTRMNPDLLLERGMELVTRATGTDPGEALMQLERNYGLRPVEDLFGALGTRCALYVLPISGLTIPKVHAVVELSDPVAFQRGLEALGRLAEDMGGGEIQVQDRPYRDTPLYTFSPKRNIGELAGDVGAPASVASLAPGLIDPELSIAVIGDRALIGISARSNKREIKRILGEEGKDIPMHPLGGESSGVPGDATSAGYMDWGSIIGGFYASFRTLMPMIAQAVQELPFGPEDLPKADLFERHFQPTVSWTRYTNGGTYEYSESSFGPEIPVAGIAAGLAAALVPRMFVGQTVEIETLPADPDPPESTPEARQAEVASKQTGEALRELKLAIVLYKGEQGRHPASLAVLLDPSPNFPGGFLEGGVVPPDGWGHAVRYEHDQEADTYRLWSTGPDGLDQSGSGDDVTLN